MDDHGSISSSDIFATASRPALGPIQPPTQWVPWALSQGKEWPVREADHSPPSALSLRIRGAVPPLLHASSCDVVLY